MKPLWWLLLGASGRGRAVLVAATTAVTSGLLLVAVSILRLGLGYDEDGVTRIPQDGLLGPIADPGTRGGAALAPVLLTVPLVLLLDQAVRLGSSARERRFAALAVAGATRGDRRRWGMTEVGAPAAVGAVLGIGVWLVLRLVLGEGLAPLGWALVPTGSGPGPWAVPVLLAVAGLGLLVGWRQGGREAALLPGAAPREARRPRWWPLLLVGVAAVLVVPTLLGVTGTGATALVVVLVVAGLVGSSPWLAWRTARLVGPRLSSPAALLAVRRLEADPRPAGRAAAAVGAVGLVGGFLGPFASDVLAETGGDAGYYLGPTALVGVLAALAVLVVSATLALHSTESVLQRRREMASLVATGVPASVVSASQRVEVLVATVPLALLGSAVTGLTSSLLQPGFVGLLAALASVTVTTAVVALAGLATGAAVRPWVRDAVQPGNLRTE